MKKILIGTVKAWLYMCVLIGIYCTLNGFKTPSQVDVVGVLAVGAILKHFVDKEIKI